MTDNDLRKKLKGKLPLESFPFTGFNRYQSLRQKDCLGYRCKSEVFFTPVQLFFYIIKHVFGGFLIFRHFFSKKCGF